jgi:hypothetical protein
MERKKARNWYWWLWLSPLVTIPTLAFSLSQEIGYDLVCRGGWQRCNWAAAERVTILIAVLVSALWHLILLRPVRNKEYPFVQWHGRQALLLAAVRTVIPLVFGLGFGLDGGALLVIPVQIVVWFGGTLWGQLQAARGKCSLMRWLGQEELLLSLQQADTQAPAVEEDENVRTLIEIVRFSRDPAQRQKALEELAKRGMVEAL